MTILENHFVGFRVAQFAMKLTILQKSFRIELLLSCLAEQRFKNRCNIGHQEHIVTNVENATIRTMRIVTGVCTLDLVHEVHIAQEVREQLRNCSFICMQPADCACRSKGFLKSVGVILDDSVDTIGVEHQGLHLLIRQISFSEVRQFTYCRFVLIFLKQVSYLLPRSNAFCLCSLKCAVKHDDVQIKNVDFVAPVILNDKAKIMVFCKLFNSTFKHVALQSFREENTSRGVRLEASVFN